MAFIVLPVAVMVLVVPTWEQRAVDAQDAARNAAVALASASDWDDGVAAADLVVAEAAEDDGLPAGAISTVFSGSLGPGAVVSASVTVAVPVGDVPGLGAVGTVHYTATSLQHVDSYRNSP